MVNLRIGIHIQQLKPCCGQALDKDTGEPLHQLIAEIMVLFACAAQANRVEGDGAGTFGCNRLIGPDVRREQPGRPQDLARADGLDGYGTALGCEYFKS